MIQKPQHLHENFIRYFCSEEDKDDDNFMYIISYSLLFREDNMKFIFIL